MEVLIIEKKTGKLVAKFPFVLRGQKYTPTDEEYFAEAWLRAVEDKIVDPGRRDEHRFELVREA